MLDRIKNKLQHVTKSDHEISGGNNMSFYRFFVFVSSHKGQKRIFNFGWKLIRSFFRKIVGIRSDEAAYYEIWMRKWFADENKLSAYRNEISSFTSNPEFCLLLFINSNNIQLLNNSLNSVKKQVYGNWKLIVVNSSVHDLDFTGYIDSCCKGDERMNLYRTVNNKNDFPDIKAVIRKSKECFLMRIDQGDILSPDALFHFAKGIINTGSNMLYSDEDIIYEHNHHSSPFFKPDWCPDSFLSRNYIGNPVVMRTSLINDEFIQDMLLEKHGNYDLLLRYTEHSTKIHHIALVLYHKKVSESIAEAPVQENTQTEINALERALGRRGIEGSVQNVQGATGIYSIRYKIVKPGKVSIIIPSKNRSDLCHVAVTSVFERTDYFDFEVILIDNNSDEPEFFEFVKFWELKEPERFKCFREEGVFNFSRLMNFGASKSTGKYLLLLNNDIEIIHSDWMSAMIEQAQFETTGVVGAKLIYKNDTIQHAGVIVGLGGYAGHVFVGYERTAGGYFQFIKCINNYSALTAACFMVSKELYKRTGGFDETLAVEFNDVDFCLRLMEQGYRNIYLPHVEIYHYESISRGHPHLSKKSYKQHLTDITVFKQRWQKYIDHDPCYNPHLTRIFTDFRIGVMD